jgi:hypothetical protein
MFLITIIVTHSTPYTPDFIQSVGAWLAVFYWPCALYRDWYILECYINNIWYKSSWMGSEFLSKSRTSLCINIYNLTPVESNSDESKLRLSRIKVLVPRCRKPYYLHSLSQIYLSKHVYYLRINRKFESTEFKTMRVNCIPEIIKNWLQNQII